MLSFDDLPTIENLVDPKHFYCIVERLSQANILVRMAGQSSIALTLEALAPSLAQSVYKQFTKWQELRFKRNTGNIDRMFDQDTVLVYGGPVPLKGTVVAARRKHNPTIFVSFPKTQNAHVPEEFSFRATPSKDGTCVRSWVCVNSPYYITLNFDTKAQYLCTKRLLNKLISSPDVTNLVLMFTGQ